MFCTILKMKIYIFFVLSNTNKLLLDTTIFVACYSKLFYHWSVQKSRKETFLWNINWNLGWFRADWQKWRKKFGTSLGIGWATSISFTSINPTRPRTNPWIFQKNIENWRTWKMTLFWVGHFNFFCFISMKRPKAFIWGIINLNVEIQN